MNIDLISWKILNAVQQDGRISLKALAGKIGLSLPATSERLKRLEESGVISDFRATVNPEAVGYGVVTIIGMTTFQPEKIRIVELLTAMPEVTECLHVTGQYTYILRVVTRDLQHLETFIDAINKFGETRTSIVLSQPIKLRSLCAPDIVDMRAGNAVRPAVGD